MVITTGSAKGIFEGGKIDAMTTLPPMLTYSGWSPVLAIIADEGL